METRPARRLSDLGPRLFALGGAALALLFLPGGVLRLGTELRQPVRLGLYPARDGSLPGRVAADGRSVRIAAVSIDGGPFRPAGGLATQRELFYLPAGTPLTYRPAGTGSAIAGTVEERETPPDRVVLHATLLLLAAALAVTGAGMALAAMGRPALHAAALLGGFAHLAGAFLPAANAPMVRDPSVREAIVLLWVAYPRYLAFYFLLSFLSSFPADVSRTRASRAFRAAVAGGALVQAVLVLARQVPGLLDRLPVAAQARLTNAPQDLGQLLFLGWLLGALWLLALQGSAFRKGTLPLQLRRRAALAGGALLVGIGPSALLGLVQIVGLFALGRLVLPSAAMALSFLPALVLPPALYHAVLAPRVRSVGLLARRAVLFAFAERTVRVASFVPLAALGVFLYRHRQLPLGELIASRPLTLVVGIAASVAGLRYADAARETVERLFFRRREGVARTVERLAERARTAQDVTSLAEVMTTGTDEALGLDSVELFVRDPSRTSYVAPGKGLPPLDASSALIEALEGSGPLDVDPLRPPRDLPLPELDRSWLAECQARLLVPLRSSDGSLLAILAAGEKRRELPFDREDRELLTAVASAGALALENHLLRSSGPSSAGGASPDPDKPSKIAPGDVEAAHLCPRCVRLFPRAHGPFCDDGTPLQPAAVPHLLAGKFRLERRIGSGGMGVVYRARDLALARDVAIKTLPRVSAAGARRFQREARAAARVIHPNLGLIFAAEAWRGTPMLVLELLDGGTLAHRIRLGKIAVSDVVAWGVALAGALEAAHEAGILHRDVKPSNVGFTGAGVPKLLDFGLARLLDEAEATGSGAPGEAASQEPGETPDGLHLTSSSRVVGTIPYLAPEGLPGAPPGPNLDLWGLALSLYEAVTGTNPFLESPVQRTVDRILGSSPPDARSLRPDCPEPLALLLADALARSPERRPATARALRERLSRAAG